MSSSGQTLTPRGQAAAGGLALAIAAAIALASPLIERSEGEVLKGYKDPVGITTACFGHTGSDVELGRTYTDAQCRKLLSADELAAGEATARCIRVEIPAEVRAAMLSFGLNAGPRNFCGSTMAAKLNAGDLAGACDELPRWVFAAGQRLPGLVKRRAAERALCLSGLPPQPPPP